MLPLLLQQLQLRERHNRRLTFLQGPATFYFSLLACLLACLLLPNPLPLSFIRIYLSAPSEKSPPRAEITEKVCSPDEPAARATLLLRLLFKKQC